MAQRYCKRGIIAIFDVYKLVSHFKIERHEKDYRNMLDAIATVALTGCWKKDKPRVLEQGAMLYINVDKTTRAMDVETRASLPIIEGDEQPVYTPLEVVKDAQAFFMDTEDGLINSPLAIGDEQKDFENARIKMWGSRLSIEMARSIPTLSMLAISTFPELTKNTGWSLSLRTYLTPSWNRRKKTSLQLTSQETTQRYMRYSTRHIRPFRALLSNGKR